MQYRWMRMAKPRILAMADFTVGAAVARKLKKTDTLTYFGVKYLQREPNILYYVGGYGMHRPLSITAIARAAIPVNAKVAFLA